MNKLQLLMGIILIALLLLIIYLLYVGQYGNAFWVLLFATILPFGI